MQSGLDAAHVALTHLVLSRLSPAHSIQVLQCLWVLPQGHQGLCPAQPQGAAVQGCKEKRVTSALVGQGGWMSPWRGHHSGTVPVPLPQEEHSALHRETLAL